MMPMTSLSLMMTRSSPSDRDVGAGIFAEQDAVACFDLRGNQLALVVAGAGANGDDFAFHGLFFGGVGNDDPTSGAFLFGRTADENTIV